MAAVVEAREGVAGGQLLQLAPQPSFPHEAAQLGVQLVQAERFGDEVGGSRMDHVHVLVANRMARDGDGVHVRVVFADVADEGDAVHAGHVHVGHHDVEGLLFQFFHRVQAVHGGLHLVADELQAFRHQLADTQLVVHHQDVLGP